MCSEDGELSTVGILKYNAYIVLTCEDEPCWCVVATTMSPKIFMIFY